MNEKIVEFIKEIRQDLEKYKLSERKEDLISWFKNEIKRYLGLSDEKEAESIAEQILEGIMIYKETKNNKQSLVDMLRKKQVSEHEISEIDERINSIIENAIANIKSAENKMGG